MIVIEREGITIDSAEKCTLNLTENADMWRVRCDGATNRSDRGVCGADGEEVGEENEVEGGSS